MLLRRNKENVDKLNIFRMFSACQPDTIAKRLLHMLAAFPLPTPRISSRAGQASQCLYKGQLCFINCMNSIAPSSIR